MSGVFSFINSFFTSLQAVGAWLLNGLLYVLKTALFFSFDGLLTCISSVLSLIDVSSVIVSASAAWAGMPPQLIWIINQVGIPQGLSILLVAIGIRMALNLIPAALTRI